METSVLNNSMQQEEMENSSLLVIATDESLSQSMAFVNERLETMGLGSELKFDSSETEDVVNIVNSFYTLLERIRLQKKQLEESRATVRRHQSEKERVNTEKEQILHQLQQQKELNQRETSRLQKEISTHQARIRVVEQQLKESRTKANEAINKFNIQAVTIKQKVNEIAALKTRLSSELNKHPTKRRVFNVGDAPVENTVDIHKEFENKISAGYEKQEQVLRARITELETIVDKNQQTMNEMIQKQNQIIQNFNASPVRRVYPSSQQSPIYETPQYRYVSLFGNGEDIETFTKSKIEQFEKQVEKITEVNEQYSAEKLKQLLTEANEIIKEQINLLYTFTNANNQEDALSFLDESENMSEENKEESC